MEEILNLIRENLTGNYESDMEFLTSLEEEENRIISNANATIEAINMIREEVENEQREDEIEEEEEVEYSESEDDERTPEEVEIDNMIDDLFEEIEGKDYSEVSLDKIENVINKIESLTDTSDEKEIHCSFSNEIERMIFEKIFAKDKKIVITPYKNDVLYILYADILLSKKRKTAALEALERAIYWNFLNREAREKKLEILYSKKQIVKYLENLKTLQLISYTPKDLSDCYNKYAYIFNELKDQKAAYAMYKLSYYYYPSEDVANVIKSFEELDPSYSNYTEKELLEHVEENEVIVGPNSKIIKAHRDITKDFLDEGMLDEAQVMLENDYNLTRDAQIAMLYNQLISVKNKKAEQEEESKKPKKRTTKKKVDNEEVNEKSEDTPTPKKRTKKQKSE